MKKLFAISAATLFAAFATTGCNSPVGTNSDTLSLLVSSEEKTGSDVTFTEYEWDDTGNQISESRTLNRAPVYDITDFEFTDNSNNYTITRIRRSYDAEGATVSHRLVTTYGLIYGNKLLETKYEEFLLTGENADPATPVIYTLTEYNSEGMRSGFKRFENGVEVLGQSNFQYDYYTGAYTYTEVKNGGRGAQFRYNPSDYGYVLYASRDGGSEIIAEKLTDFNEVNSTTISFKITRYDEEGNNGVETEITNKYRFLTIETQY